MSNTLRIVSLENQVKELINSVSRLVDNEDRIITILEELKGIKK